MTGADIVVIGGGMAGASAAFELASAAKVVVLERESACGYHATGRSAASFTENYGTATIRRLAKASRPFLERPPEGFAGSPLLAPRGMLTVARADQRAALRDELERALEFVPTMRRVSVDEALALVPVLRRDYLDGAILEPNSMDIDVHGLHQGFLKGIRRRGGTVIVDAEVTALERDGRRWRVSTRAGPLSADIVINAAGAWADEIGRLAGAAPIGLVPKRRTAFTVDAPAGTAVEAWPLANDVGAEFYFKPDAGRLFVSPADATPSLPTDAQAEDIDVAEGVDRLERATTIAVTRVVRRWAGLRSFVTDGSPVAGFDPEARGFFWLAGQGGYGIKTASALARATAALISAGRLPEDQVALGLSAAQLSPARLRGMPVDGGMPATARA
ncbi:MAG: FAD-binding oxidoreductase [Alphaproteobacteria bacterium]|nr:FAD-binding oxidoreductase [Alphaproteobacteria bacterium]